MASELFKAWNWMGGFFGRRSENIPRKKIIQKWKINMEDQKVEICHGPWAMAHHYPFRCNLGKVISKVPFVIMSGLPPFLINSGMGSHCCASMQAWTTFLRQAWCNFPSLNLTYNLFCTRLTTNLPKQRLHVQKRPAQEVNLRVLSSKFSCRPLVF